MGSTLTTRSIEALVVSSFFCKFVECSDSGLTNSLGAATNGPIAGHEAANETYKVVQLDWSYVQDPLIIALWILLAIMAKMCFHLSKKLAQVFPDSSCLIMLGLAVGFFLHFVNAKEGSYHLSSQVFFLFLLPPIVFDAGYFMPNRAFFDNIGTILIYAVIGTLWNTITIGLSLWAISLTGLFKWTTNLLQMLTFSSLISAVDPVAVLVVFEEIHVNAMLYIVVFGESLLNDAVTVVLYEMFESFTSIGAGNLSIREGLLGILAFFVVSIGGVAVGFICAYGCAFLTKFTKHVRVIEPLLVMIVAYISYLVAQMFHLSAILAIVFCGIAMKRYVEANISQKSKTTLQYLLKMASTCCEAIIFMFLGLSTVTKNHGWDAPFVCLTILFCLVYRAIGVVVLTFFVNKTRLVKLAKVDQFIMSYGGLRGAIAYGLANSLKESHFKCKPMLLTTTIVVIYFTVFLQGMTIKPLVNFLKVKKEEYTEPTMCAKIFGRNIDHLSAGIESIVGQWGSHRRRIMFEKFNEKFLKPSLLRDVPKEKDHSIMKKFTELNLKAAMDHVEKFGTFTSVSSVNRMAVEKVDLPELDDRKAMLGYANPAFQSSTHNLQSPDELIKGGIKYYSRHIESTPRPSPRNSPVDNNREARTRENGFLQIPVPEHRYRRNFDANSHTPGHRPRSPRSVAFSVPQNLRSHQGESFDEHSAHREKPTFTAGPTVDDIVPRTNNEVPLDPSSLGGPVPNTVLQVDTLDTDDPANQSSSTVISSYGGTYRHPGDRNSSSGSSPNDSQASSTRYSSIVRVDENSDTELPVSGDLHHRTSRL